MTPAIVPYVSAISVMLAAYGFFYNALKDRIDAGLDVGDPAGNEVGKKAQRDTVKNAKLYVLILGLVPLLIWLVFLPPVIEEAEAAIDVCFSLSHYSALDVVFVLLANTWLLIGIFVLVKLRALGKEKKRLGG